MGTESWFSNFWRNSGRGSAENDKAAIGVLAYEVASLMSKVVSFWHFLSDQEILRLKKDILKSVGIRKLVADDNDHVMDLALNEIMENFRLISSSVARLGRRCVKPPFCHFEHFINDPLGNLEWFEWDYRLKKMERKVKKMERFVAFTMQLSQEVEVLAELEQTLRRMKANPDVNRGKLVEFRQKVTWQRQEVRNLQEMSPWIRTYDYIVRLLARSLLTILQRIKYVFEISQLSSTNGNEHVYMNPTCLPRSHSVSVLMQASIHPSENILCGISTGPLCKSDSMSRIVVDKNKKNEQQHHSKTNRLSHVGPFKECMMSGSESPFLESYKSTFQGSVEFNSNCAKSIDKIESLNAKSPPRNGRIYSKLALFSSKSGLLDASPSTLGHAELALHYANVIVLVENLASSPHLIDYKNRDDLYNMLPTTIRAALRTRFKGYGKSLGSFAYDASLAEEWSRELKRTLKWLSPLAHNMIRWHSERNFEREQEVSRTNVLLVQTLHYANQAKTEAAITELLVGLNYICRINGYLNETHQPESSVFRVDYSSEKGRQYMQRGMEYNKIFKSLMT
ncbi:hypothetical protein JCGZ_27054 [Jatropha curcas]|uniref:DUF668 domain-containing protein n=1 Tax=Jatropha curcas TaxID=180498 RepID=A0A067LF15_JATCU|nr:protein PSK SIMULATOR 2 [Jatropha curcas]KDP43105.1 hypothetical protein JCGZ_27054 [Jatropha curcas]